MTMQDTINAMVNNAAMKMKFHLDCGNDWYTAFEMMLEQSVAGPAVHAKICDQVVELYRR